MDNVKISDNIYDIINDKRLLENENSVKKAKISGGLFAKLKNSRLKFIDREVDREVNKLQHEIDSLEKHGVFETSDFDYIKDRMVRKLEKLNAKTIKINDSKYISDDLAGKVKLTSERIKTLKANIEALGEDNSLGDDDLSSLISDKDKIDTMDKIDKVDKPEVLTSGIDLTNNSGEYHYSKAELEKHQKSDAIDFSDVVPQEATVKDKVESLEPIKAGYHFDDDEQMAKRNAMIEANKQRSQAMRDKLFATSGDGIRSKDDPNRLDTDLIHIATKAALKAYKDSLLQMKNNEKGDESTYNVDDAYKDLEKMGVLTDAETERMAMLEREKQTGHVPQGNIIADDDISKAYDIIKEMGVVNKNNDDYINKMAEAKTNGTPLEEVAMPKQEETAKEKLERLFKVDGDKPEEVKPEEVIVDTDTATRGYESVLPVENNPLATGLNSHESYNNQVEEVAARGSNLSPNDHPSYNDQINSVIASAQKTTESRKEDSYKLATYHEKTVADNKAYNDLKSELVDNFQNGVIGEKEANELSKLLSIMLDESKKQRVEEFNNTNNFSK